jgi:hypothetical protein
VTALMLTLIVLPALYYLLETRKDRIENGAKAEAD